MPLSFTQSPERESIPGRTPAGEQEMKKTAAIVIPRGEGKPPGIKNLSYHEKKLVIVAAACFLHYFIT
jgi:hypothetical protein